MKHPTLFLTLLTACLALFAGAAEPTGAPLAVKAAPEERRYLFIVDVSGGTKHCREAIAQTVHDLVASGMNGEMKPGDAFAIWPYRNKVMTEAFKPQMWVPAAKEDLAKTAGEFIRQQDFSNTAMALIATGEAMKVVQASRHATILIINDGSEYLQGTPYDDYVNKIYKERSIEMWREKKPFVTTLLGVNGHVVGCTVSTGGEIVMPQVPAALQKLLGAEPVAQAAPAPPSKPLPVAVPVPVVRPASVPAAGTGPQLSRANSLPSDPGPAVAMPLTAPATVVPPAPAPVVVRTPAPALLAPPVAPAAIPATIPAPTSSPAAPAASDPPLVAAPPSVVVAAASATLVPPASGPVPAAPAPPTDSVAPAIMAGSSPSTSGLSGTSLLLLAIALVAVAGLIVWFMIRNQREPKHPSLITRSMRR